MLRRNRFPGRFIPYRNEMSNSCLLRRILVDHSIANILFFSPILEERKRKGRKEKEKKQDKC